MAVLQEYKCPCCGGAIGFDSGIQKMKCPFCDTEFEMEALAAYDSELNNEQADALQWEQASTESWQADDNIRSFVCKSCGGEIIGDENTAATACPYCGNPVVMMSQFTGALKPDCVIPFQLDLEQLYPSAGVLSQQNPPEYDCSDAPEFDTINPYGTLHVISYKFINEWIRGI